MTDDLIVESLDEGRPTADGEPGEAVITSLTSQLMPFIRYRLGDRIVLSERACACGHPYPVIERVEGRNDDFLINRAGERISPHAVIPPLAQNFQIVQYRVTETELERFVIEYVSRTELGTEKRREIEELFQEHFESPSISFRRLDELSPDSGGKIRKVICAVPSIC